MYPMDRDSRWYPWLAVLLHEPLHGSPQALVEVHLGLPAEEALRLGGVGEVAAHLAAAGVRVADLYVLDARLGQGGDQLVRKLPDGRLGVRGDLERLAADAFGGDGELYRPYKVADVDVVAGLGAVAVDLEHLAVRGALDEPGDDAVLVAGEGPVDVAEAEGHRPYVEGLKVGRAVALAGQLARAVGGHGMRGHLLVDGGLYLPDHRPPARGEDEAP